MREAFILVTYFNELNKTVYSMLSAKNVFVLTESSTAGCRILHSKVSNLFFSLCYNQESALTSVPCEQRPFDLPRYVGQREI